MRAADGAAGVDAVRVCDIAARLRALCTMLDTTPAITTIAQTTIPKSRTGTRYFGGGELGDWSWAASVVPPIEDRISVSA
jgi:hypothetical protein